MARGTWGSGGTDIHPLSVRIQFQMGTVLGQTGFKLRDTSLQPADPQEAADDVAVWVSASLVNVFHNTDRILGVDVVDMTTGEGGAHSFANLAGTIGGGLDAVSPSYLQVPVSLKGELRRRYGQGRMLWPVRYETMYDNNLLNATGVAALQGAIDAFQARYLGSGSSSDYTLINVHGQIASKAATPTTPARDAVPPSWYDVTTIRLGRIMSFLRSRHVNVGS
jgi:hypothetical protein